jgi:hypothetical protein
LSAEEAATKIEGKPERAASSFAKSLFLGEIHEEMVFPWPEPDPVEADRVRAHDGDRQARLHSRQVRLRPVRRLSVKE